MRVPLVLMLLAACGNGTPEHSPAVREADAAGTTMGAEPQSPGEPGDTLPPVARRGALVARTAGASRSLDGRWRPQAGLCRNPPGFELLAQNDSVDVLVLLRLPADSAATGSYGVPGLADSTAAPRTARMGVQRLQFTDLAYRAVRGTVWLERLDRATTGRFDVTLQEVTSHQELRYRGVFDEVGVDTLDAAACAAAAKPDSAGRAPRRDGAA